MKHHSYHSDRKQYIVNEKLTTIQLSNTEAELFKQFCQFHDQFNKLVSAEFFTVKGSGVIVHFDDSSAIRKVEIIKVSKFD